MGGLQDRLDPDRLTPETFAITSKFSCDPLSTPAQTGGLAGERPQGAVPSLNY